MFRSIKEDQEERYDQGSTKSRETQTRNKEEMLSHAKLVDQNLTEVCMTEIHPIRLILRAV